MKHSRLCTWRLSSNSLGHLTWIKSIWSCPKISTIKTSYRNLCSDNPRLFCTYFSIHGTTKRPNNARCFYFRSFADMSFCHRVWPKRYQAPGSPSVIRRCLWPIKMCFIPPWATPQPRISCRTAEVVSIKQIQIWRRRSGKASGTVT